MKSHLIQALHASRTSDTSIASSETSSSIERSSSEKIVSKLNDDQKGTLIVCTQMSSEENGYELSYRGEDTWNIAVNYIDGVNNWIVTANDKNYGRVKVIYKWSGNEEDGSTLIYLLINGNELINNPNN